MIKKLLRKFSESQKWNNIEYPISESSISDKLINKIVNRFWEEYFKDIGEDKYLILMFRVRLINDDIKTLTKLQKLRFSSKEFLKSYLSFKSNLIRDAYDDSPIKGIIFSWGIRDFKNLRKEFSDSVMDYLKPIESKTYSHNFKNIKGLPIDVDLNLYGEFLNNLDNFKSIAIPKNRIINVEISNNLEGLEIRKFSLIKDNKIRLIWEDKIVNLEENSLIRTIGNTIIEFEKGAMVYSRVVIPLKRISKIKPSKKINKNIIAADLETILSKDNIMVPYLASFSSNKEEKTFLNKDLNILFSNFFRELFLRKNKNFKIYFHNLSNFDGIFLLRRLSNLKYKIEPLIHNGKLIQIKVNKNNLTWFINDSYLLLLNSLDKLGKSFNIEISKGIFPYFISDINYKGDFPAYEFFNKEKISVREYEEEAKKFKKTPWDFKMESIKYCLNDSVLLRKILLEFNNFIFNSFNIDISKYPTIPSLAFAIFRSRYLKENEIGLIPVNSKIYKNIRQSYTGGSTDMFIPKNPEGVKIYAYDVNALYPFVMKEFAYPIGDPSYIEIPLERSDLTLNLSLFGFFYSEIEAPNNLSHPIIQIHHPINKRTVSPLGNFSGWFFSEELKNALNFGYKIRISKGYIFEKGFIFKDWVTDLYNLRTKYEKSHPMNYISKILLNSLYGRFGMGELSGRSEIVSKKEFNSFTEEDKIDILDTIELGKNILIQYREKLILDEELGDSRELSNINIAIASAVTAYARIHMSEFKNNPNLPNLYYSDTDSLYFDGPLPDSFISPTILGKLKLEGVWDQALFLAPKVYALKNSESFVENIKIKGLKKEIFKDITLDQLTPLLKRGEILEFKQNKWFKSLDEGNIKILETIYSLRVTDNKRELIYDNNNILIGTKPFNL
jgi:DNA polymerase type B, organellar and viral